MITRSDFPDVQWPPLNLGYSASIAALVAQLQQTERMPIEDIHFEQNKQLAILVKHHILNTASFAERVKNANLISSKIDRDWLKKLPTINKEYIQQCSSGFSCLNVPKQHLPVGEAKTSGSTGQPVTVARSAITQVIWEAMTVRDHQWNKRNYNGRLCAIRANIEKETVQPNWGATVNRLYKSGPSLGMNISSNIDHMMKRLREFQPNILVIHAGALLEMIDVWNKNGFDLHDLKHIKNIGDTVSDELRSKMRALTGLEIEDNYSSSETGVIALQCPEGKMYHLCEEGLIVEILREDGTDCSPGEVGRVVVTDLLNFASPLIRYDLGDYAEVGHGCTCGRTLPTLKRIIGRERNIFLRPDGTRFWPKAGMHEIPNIAPVKQWQIIQHDVNNIEYKLVLDVELTDKQKEDIVKLAQKNFGYNPNVIVSTQTNFIPRKANGKFEEALCLIKR